MKSSSQANRFSEIVISAKYTEHNITRFNKATQNNTFYIKNCNILGFTSAVLYMICCSYKIFKTMKLFMKIKNFYVGLELTFGLKNTKDLLLLLLSFKRGSEHRIN
jgi:hypothetical protein